MPPEPHAPPLYPYRFAPVLKDYVWGGRNLERVLGRRLPEGRVAESWEISDHPHGETLVSGGPCDQSSLAELLDRYGTSLVGRRNAAAVGRRRFPLLVKLLDAQEWLSVQVHPGEGQARVAHEPANEPADEPADVPADDLGKSEMWVVLHAEPDAEIILGFRSGTAPEELERALDDGTVDSLLQRVPARQGDVFFVPAGTVHAIGPGLLLAEIQQTSDVTYRLFDWNRSDEAGRSRPLHIAEALEVTDFSSIRPGAVAPVALETGPLERELLAECPYFRTERLRLGEGSCFRSACDGSTFEIWALLQGRATLASRAGSQILEPVSWLLLPADLGEFELRSRDPGAELLRVLTPELS